MIVSKNTTNKEYIHGDFDKDGTPNIDDKKPFDPRVKEQVNKEVRLSDTFSYVDLRRKQAERQAVLFHNRHPESSYRVKDTYSIVNKAVRRNPAVTNDFIGFRIQSDTRKEANNKWNLFNKQQGIGKRKLVLGEYVEKDNKYVSNKGKTNLYRGMHTNFIIKNGKQRYGAEMQFWTKKYGDLNNSIHERYKQGKKTTVAQQRQSRSLLRHGF